MREQIYLFLSTRDLSVYEPDKGRLRCLERFLDDEAGRAAFAEFVQAHRQAFYYLMVDGFDEDFQLISIPKLTFRDRARMLERKLDQHYRASPYRFSFSQGLEKVGPRKEERVLLAGLTNPETLDHWLNPLLAAECRLVGVYSTALVTSRLMKRYDHVVPHRLLVSRQQGSGLRQSYFLQNGVKFSRLSVIDDSMAYGGQVLSEVMRARQYLQSTRSLGRGDVLEVMVMGNASELAELTEVCVSDEQVRYAFVNYEDMSRRLGLLPPDADQTAEVLLLQGIAKKHIRNIYAPPSHTRFYDYWRWGRNLLLASLCVVLLGAVGGGWQYWQEQQIEQQILLVQEDTQNTRTEIEHLLGLAKGQLADPAVMKALADSYQAMVRQWPSFRPDLKTLSQALERDDKVYLTQVNWGVGDSADYQPLGESAAQSGATAEEGAQPENPTGEQYVVMVIEGFVLDPKLTAREALARINQFMKNLKADGSVEVTALALPLDTRMEGELKQSLQFPATGDVPPQPFRLKWVKKVPGAGVQP